MLSFIHSVNRYDASRFSKHVDPSKLPKTEGFNKVYSKFLLYRDFFGSDRPVLMFEGRTDNIYIRCAIRSLAKNFPCLAQVDASGNVTLLARLYNYSNTTREILDLGGGSDNLRKFLIRYIKLTAKFRAPQSKYPVIILIDNDKGAKPIYGLLREITGAQITGNEAFIKICSNIYVVPTPKLGAAESCIEDFFDKPTLSVKLGGKSFDKSNDFDSAQYYGKVAFARSVVKQNERKIDFSGFAPILSTMDGIIDAHGK